jgi:hypothetical protein
MYLAAADVANVQREKNRDIAILITESVGLGTNEKTVTGIINCIASIDPARMAAPFCPLW